MSRKFILKFTTVHLYILSQNRAKRTMFYLSKIFFYPKLLLLCTILAQSHIIKLLEKSTIDTEIKKFLKQHSPILQKSKTTSLIIKTTKSTEILNWYLKQYSTVCLIDNLQEAKEKHISNIKSDSILIFMDTHKSLNETNNQIVRSPLWSPKSRILFLILEETKTLKPLEIFAKTIWKSKIIDFVIISIYKQKLNVFAYNEFLKINQLLNYTKRIGKPSLFPNKLVDMNGYTLKIGMFEDPPRLKKTSFGQWKGRDYDLLKIVMFIMNATLKIVETPRSESLYGVYNLTASCTIDFSFVKYYYIGDMFNDVDFSYPSRLDNLVVVAPRAKLIPQSAYLYLVFGHKILALFSLTIVSISVILKIGQKNSYISCLLDSWRVFLNTAIPNLHEKDFSKKCLLCI